MTKRGGELLGEGDRALRGWSGHFTVATAYVGSVLGVGLVSGKEVVAAFSAKGEGWVGFVITGIILAMGGGLLAGSAARWGTGSYGDFLRQVGGRGFGRVLDLGVSGYLVAGLATGLAGGGELLSRWAALPPRMGAAALTLAFLAVLRLDFAVFLGASRMVVPVILLAMGSVALLAGRGISPGSFGGGTGLLFSALMYGFFNLLAALVVVAAVGKRLEKRWAWAGGAAGGVFLAVMIFLVERAVRTEGAPLPLVAAAGRVSPHLGAVYGVLLGLALLTSIGGGVYGMAARFRARGGRFFGSAVIILGAYGLSLAGLAAIVQYLYLLAGGLGLVIFVGLGIRRWEERRG